MRPPALLNQLADDAALGAASRQSNSKALLAKLRVYEDALKEIASKRVYDGWIDRTDKYQSGYADARRRDVKTAKDALANAGAQTPSEAR